MRNNQKPANLFGNIEKDNNGQVIKPRHYYIRNRNVIISPDDISTQYRSINEAKKESRKLIQAKKIVYVND